MSPENRIYRWLMKQDSPFVRLIHSEFFDSEGLAIQAGDCILFLVDPYYNFRELAHLEFILSDIYGIPVNEVNDILERCHEAVNTGIAFVFPDPDNDICNS